MGKQIQLIAIFIIYYSLYLLYIALILLICTGLEPGSVRDIPHSLIVLLEEEVVAIDLSTNGWPPYRLPYMNR